jgi:myxalamid-type polyketide synthase MxaE and MxaD
VAELLSPGHEDQVALRGAARYVPRLTRLHDLPAERSPVISADATYLVTGGLGDLGPRIARWLIRRGARSLVLTSRTALPDRSGGSGPLDERARRRTETVEALQALGAEIEVVACDAGDEAAMRALIERLLKRERPLRGIIHAAGQSFLKPCIELDRAALEAAWSAKAAGGLAIHRAVQGAPLDFVVYFSSAAAVWGSAGLAHYAAANRLLDALAVAGRRRGLPALSINWARWGTAIAELEAYFDRIGLEVMEEGAALEAMETLLAAGKANAVVAAVDWERFRAVYSARRRRPLLDELESGPPARTEPQPAVDWREALASILPSERRAWLLDRVRTEVGRTIGLASPAGLDPEQGFFDLGMDSLMAVELKKRLESATGRSLATSLTFDYPTVAALTGYLATEVFAFGEPRTAEPRPAEPEDSATLLDRIEQLSDEDVERLLYSGGAGRE